jgi:hypothetical protein
MSLIFKRPKIVAGCPRVTGSDGSNIDALTDSRQQADGGRQTKRYRLTTDDCRLLTERTST